ncbi:hypothetical protein [Paenibacillus sp. JCM 10914]
MNKQVHNGEISHEMINLDANMQFWGVNSVCLSQKPAKMQLFKEHGTEIEQHELKRCKYAGIERKAMVLPSKACIFATFCCNRDSTTTLSPCHHLQLSPSD